MKEYLLLVALAAVSILGAEAIAFAIAKHFSFS